MHLSQPDLTTLKPSMSALVRPPSHLHLVQNAAARLLTGKRKGEHISPIMSLLHFPCTFQD